MNKRLILVVCYDQRQAMDALYRLYENEKTKVNEGLLRKVEVSKTRMMVETDNEIVHYKSGKAIDRGFYLGRHFDEAYGLEYIRDNEIYEEIKMRIKP